MSISNLTWMDFGMMVFKLPLLMGNGKISVLDYGRVLTLFWYGERAYLCFSQDENVAQLIRYMEQRDAYPDVADNNPEKPKWDPLCICSWSTDFSILQVGKEKKNYGHRQWYMTFRLTCYSRVPDSSKIFSCWVWQSNSCMFCKEWVALEGCVGVFPKLISNIHVIPSYCSLKVIG